ncbi:hypothetical protein B9Z65_4441 [Elsinoe australis]|uniref:Uncharacterized protein n=1 Tax=Elsinoe australis TaxID=40998 RepID=A0A2P7Z2T8_9PEZI|nr:hypothetical protein B9Z65_4441 [Elsinoe australis]
MQLQALVTLFLAGSALACRCQQNGSPQGSLDVPATEDACTFADGTIVNGQTKNVLVRGCPLMFKSLPLLFTLSPSLTASSGSGDW